MTELLGIHKEREEGLTQEIESYQIKKRFNAFNEKYKYQDVRFLYGVLDDPLLPKKSKWKYTEQDIAPHKKAITQETVVSCKDDLNFPVTTCTATQL